MFDSVPHTSCTDSETLQYPELDPYIIQWMNIYLVERWWLSSISMKLSMLSHQSSLSQFANDMAFYHPIRTMQDYFDLQLDISPYLYAWINNNHLSCNCSLQLKCCAVLISRSDLTQMFSRLCLLKVTHHISEAPECPHCF